jgi:hypothetical protein
MRRLAVLALGLAASACVDHSRYLELGGGGFIFNYRDATAIYGVVIVARRDPPSGATIEASFEDPAGGDAARKGRMDFETPPLTGIKKGIPYHVVVVLHAADGAELARLEKDFQSDVDQSALPERPLAIGPGYQKNIDESTSAFPPTIYRQPADQGAGQ